MTAITKACTKGWPPSRRRAQAERCRSHRPWTRSTGPRSAAGKAKSARNARKHGFRTPAMAQIRALLRWQNQCLKHIRRNIPPPPLPAIPLIPAPPLAKLTPC